MRRHQPRALAASAALLTLLTVLVTGAAPAAAAPVRGPYVIDPAGPAADAVFPEGVATDRHQHFYVGSTTDGTIYRGSLRGSTATPFLPGGVDGRTSAIGMKVFRGRLYVAGGATGKVFVYDLSTKALVGSFAVPAGGGTFLNDIAIGPDGSAYVTDSVRPMLYRIAPDGYATSGVATLQVFRDFTGTVLQYQPGFNVNGIVVTRNNRWIVLTQSNTGLLFRVAVDGGAVSSIDLGGATVSGDGLVLRGRILYAIERQGSIGYVVTLRLSGQLITGRVLSRTTDPTFDDPTTAAIVRGRMLVVNSQFGVQATGQTPDPFTVSSIKVPRPYRS